jgi:hypothetical protein
MPDRPPIERRLYPLASEQALTDLGEKGAAGSSNGKRPGMVNAEVRIRILGGGACSADIYPHWSRKLLDTRLLRLRQ